MTLLGRDDVMLGMGVFWGLVFGSFFCCCCWSSHHLDQVLKHSIKAVCNFADVFESVWRDKGFEGECFEAYKLKDAEYAFEYIFKKNWF